MTFLRRTVVAAVLAAATLSTAAAPVLPSSVPAARAAAPAAAPAAPPAPVVVAQNIGTELLVKVLNPDKTLIYRMSRYIGGRSVGAAGAGSFDGRFHLGTPVNGAGLTYVVQAVRSWTVLSPPAPESLVTLPAADSYGYVFNLAPPTATTFAKAVEAWADGVSGCSGGAGLSTALKKLGDLAARSERVSPVDDGLLTRWTAALAAAQIPTKTCTGAISVVTFANAEVTSYLAGKTSFPVTVQARWAKDPKTKQEFCAIRWVAGDAKGRTGAPSITDVAVDLADEASCHAHPRAWY